MAIKYTVDRRHFLKLLSISAAGTFASTAKEIPIAQQIFAANMAEDRTFEQVAETLAPQLLYVAPTKRGDGSGLSAMNAADYLDFSSPDGFWQKTVPTSLQTGNVNVQFLSGDYTSGTLQLTGVGHPTHRLILQGNAAQNTILQIGTGDSPKSTILVTGCQNLIFRHLVFTGDGEIDYVLRFTGTQNVLVEDCVWRDLPNVTRGATGTRYPSTFEITYKRCIFTRVGKDSGAHIMYNAYDAHHINVINCVFEDCSGEYVRFRDNVDYCVVSGCAFLNTGTFPQNAPASYPFVTMPLHNNCEPGSVKCPDPETHSQYEYFGTHYTVVRNRFVYELQEGAGDRYAVAFYHYGFDPPGRNHLMTAEEGEVLAQGTSLQRKALLKRNCGIDMDKVIVYDNYYSGEEVQVAFGSEPDYGAVSRGWQGFVDVSDLINRDSVLSQSQWLESLLTMPVQGTLEENGHTYLPFVHS